MTPEERAWELIARYLDGDADPALAEELDRLVRRDPAAARLFAEATRQEDGLRFLHADAAAARVPRASTGAEAGRARPPRRRWRLAAAAAGILIAGAAAYVAVTHTRMPAEPSPVARVDGMPREATLVRGSAPVPVKAGLAILPGDMIETKPGGGAALQYIGEKTRLEVGPAAAVSLQDASGAKRVRVERGEVSAEVARQPAGRPMAFVTPHAEAEVLGTSLRLAVAGASTRLEVTAGRVRLARLADGARVEVADGQCAVAAPGAALVATPIAAAPSPAPPARGVVRITPATRNDTRSAATIRLADGGKALLPIVVSPKASDAVRAVAADLADVLKRISGASFEVKAGDGAEGIVLGTLADFPDAGLAEALAIVDAFDGREAFAIRTDARRLRLLGATDLGASHAAYRCLEELGARWYFPAKEWEVLPRLTSLSFGRDITDRPSILSRVIWFEAGSGGEAQNAEYAAWKRRNRQAESFSVNAGHNLDTVIQRNKAAFDAHPEYYALVRQKDGSMKRQGPQLELAHPAVRKMVVDYAVGFFKENPRADMVSLDPADTVSHSESPESLALGSVSDRVFGMANEAARALRKECPGKRVGLYSYNAHWDPPSAPLEPNVHVLLAGLGQGRCTPAEREALWPQRCRNLGFYEYYSVWLWSYDRLPGSWTNDLQGSQARAREIVARGGTSVSAESTSSWGPNGRGYYVANRLLWNPDLDVDALAQDFHEKAFGPGAAAMKRYYDRLDPGKKPFLSKHLLALAFRDVDEASRKAADRPDVQARLDHVKQYLRYVHLDWMRNREPATEPQKQALSTAIMTSLYRMRIPALVSWEMIRQNWGGNKYPGKDRELWMVETPCTHEETEREFQEGVAYFQPRQIGEAVAFSADLVPVRWPDRPSVKSEQAYQGGAKYLLYSLRGEPLEFTTWAGNAWGGINRFTITDAKGAEIAKGQLPNDKTTPHAHKVPGPGLYTLDYNDNGSYWSITVEPGRVATIPMGQTQDYRNSKVMQEMFFYVPKGTRRIEYYYTKTAFHPGGPHKVIDPAGNVAQAVDVNGDWVSVPVPAGMDGKLWRLREPVLGIFWFNNVPNYIAASPDALLVPREVAVKDGLPAGR